MSEKQRRPASENRDPITDAPGVHPVGVGIGAAAGGVAAGAAAGTLAAGPVGTVVGAAVGAAVGAVVGGLGGKAVAEHYDPTVEEQHWRGNFDREPYYQRGMTFNDYAPAYKIGGEAHGRYGDATFEDVQDDLAGDYELARGQSRLGWEDAKSAANAAWTRVRG